MSEKTEALVEALYEARGCGCCARYAPLAAVVPCGPACEVDEDGYVDHSYGSECARDFEVAVRRAFEVVAEEARREAVAGLAERMNRAAGGLRAMARSTFESNATRLRAKANGLDLAISYAEEVLR